MGTVRRAIGTILIVLAAIGVAAEEPQKSAVCTLKVTGMTCGGCAAAVKSAAKKVDGVKEAVVSYDKGVAEVTYDPAKTTPAAIARVVTQRSGFKAEVQTPKGK